MSDVYTINQTVTTTSLDKMFGLSQDVYVYVALILFAAGLYMFLKGAWNN